MDEHDHVSPNSFLSSPNEPGRFRSFWVPFLLIGLIAIGGADLYQINQTSDLRAQLAAANQDTNELRTRLTDTDTNLHQAMDALHTDLEHVTEQSSADLAKAQSTVTHHADVVAGRVAKKQEEQLRKQEEQARALNEELGKVKESTEEASSKLDDKIEGVNTQVGSVKGDVETAKSDIQDTKSELQRARTDLGTMSGLIATNSKQIQVLRDLGDRNIFEFTIERSAGAQKVGNIQVALKKTDPKHNRYSVDVVADDKRLEKKDRSINEPVQFYTSGAHQPYELVINQVQKDKVIGYLATPKVTLSRGGGSEE